MNNNDNYSFTISDTISELVVQMANVQAQNATILKILSRNMSESEKDDYSMFKEYSLIQHTISVLKGGQNPEGETLSRLSSELAELELKLKQRGLITE